MFHFGSTTNNDTTLFGQSTPTNSNRAGYSFLFGNTTAIPPSTPFSLGATITLPPSTLDTTAFQKYEPLTSSNKRNNNETRAHDDEIHRTLSLPSTTLPTSFLFNTKPTATTTTFFVGKNPSNFVTGNSSSFFPTTTTNTSFTLPSSTTVSPLFSTVNQATTSTMDLQLFQTMLNTQPFNNELAFLARHVKPDVHPERVRARPTSHSSTSRPTTATLFSTVRTKPTVLSSVSTKRKLADSFLDEEDEKSLLITDDSSSSITKLSKLNIKRPRMLDMNKIRSIVLGTTETTLLQPSTSENQLEWKKFPNYDEYLTVKKQEIPLQRSFRLPKLTRKDYYTKPTIEELRSSFNEQGQCLVKEFTVGRKHYGSVTFQGAHMNLAALDLDRLVEIDHRQVTVYPNETDRPREGEELNCQAIIALLGVYPIDRSISHGGEEVTDPDRLIEMDYGKYLEGMTKKFEGQFIDYDVHTGTWSFQVEHF